MSPKYHLFNPEESEQLTPVEEEGPSIEHAKEILGAEKILIPQGEAAKKALGFELKELPPIPFSDQELKRAKELGQYLTYRTEKDKKGEPLTVQSMEATIDDMLGHDDRSLWKSNTWYENDPVYTETPTEGWALVTPECVDGTKSQNYLQQTETLVAYLKTQIFQGQPLPEPYQQAVQEFESQKPEMQAILDDSTRYKNEWQKLAKQLTNLKITQLLRPNFADYLYDWGLQMAQNNRRLNETDYTYTRSRSSSHRLVCVGWADADGANVDRWKPGVSSGGLGARLSRSLSA